MRGDPWFGDEDWDEDRWEAFLRDNDRRVDRYMELFFLFMRKFPYPGGEDGRTLTEWKRALRTFLRERGWRRDDLILPFLWLDEEATEDGGAPPAGDGLLVDPEDADDTLDDVRRVPLYGQAMQLTADVLDWAHSLSDDLKDSTLVHYCSHVSQIPAHVARGHGLGVERDALGGYIACVKRALAEANAALALLSKMKHTPYMEPAVYPRLYERTYEVRNALGLYVQELRDRFNLGID